MYKGGLGASPPEVEENLKQIKQNGGFFLSFFAFWQGSLNPQIMSLLPSSPRIITSDPQLPEWPFSPDPQNPWGGPVLAINSVGQMSVLHANAVDFMMKI